jgi:hypothetical protein
MRPVYGESGSVVAVVDSSGAVTLGDGPGPVVGVVRGNEIFGDEAGSRLLGRVDADGRIIDADYEIIGRVEASLLVADSQSRRVGRVHDPVDGGVLLLLVEAIDLAASAAPPVPDEGAPTVMDEVLAVESIAKYPAFRGRRDPF